MRHQMSKVAMGFAGVVHQKIKVLEAVKEGYTAVCPMVGASIGQHMRHSLDHWTRVAEAVDTIVAGIETVPLLRYDVRDRGTGAETDPIIAKEEVLRARDVIIPALANDKSLLDHEVFAQFTMSHYEDSFHDVKSTVERELAFVTHHAYHHLAMIRIIALHHLHLSEHDLPPHLGRAPATLLFDLEATG